MNQRGPVEGLTVSTTVVQLPQARGEYALIYVSGAPIRWSSAGAPSATSGMYVGAGGYIDLTAPGADYSEVIRSMSLVRDTTAASDATLSVMYFS